MRRKLLLTTLVATALAGSTLAATAQGAAPPSSPGGTAAGSPGVSPATPPTMTPAPGATTGSNTSGVNQPGVPNTSTPRLDRDRSVPKRPARRQPYQSRLSRQGRKPHALTTRRTKRPLPRGRFSVKPDSPRLTPMFLNREPGQRVEFGGKRRNLPCDANCFVQAYSLHPWQLQPAPWPSPKASSVTPAYRHRPQG
jgi:hypothetical protein